MALVFVANGSEEMETVISIDVLRRAKIDVTVAGLDDNIVECSRLVNIKPDTNISAIKDKMFDVVVLPGGYHGAERLANSDDVGDILRRHENAGKLIAAICAAPTALAKHGIGKGKNVTSYPAMKDKMHEYKYSENRVEKDGNLITSRSPGTAFEFAFEIVRTLKGDAVVEALKNEMLCL